MENSLPDSGPRSDGVVITRDATARMRDGVLLHADIYAPGDHPEPMPVLIQRTPYDKSLYTELGALYARAGYLTVIQDVRGQFRSEGEWDPFVHEGDDGEDTVDWAADLPGSSGAVGMTGTSYQATCAWQVAIRRPPALAALACAVTPVDYYDDWIFPNGAFSLSFNTTWLLRNVANSAALRLADGPDISAAMTAAYDDIADTWYRHLPLRDFPPLLPERGDVASYFFDWINEHPVRDNYWDTLSLRQHLADIEIPVLNVAGWYDVFVQAGVDAHQGLTGSRRSELVIGPWGHNNWAPELGDMNFGPAATWSFPNAVIAWMDRWLKGISADSTPTTSVRYFSMGDNQWKHVHEWPPPNRVAVTYRLTSDGSANSRHGDGRLVAEGTRLPDARDVFDYDPDDPVPSVGGQGCCYEPQSPIGPRDQSAIEERSDILVYTSSELAEPVEVAGDVWVEIWAATSAADTDFTAKLVDVHPSGTAINLCQGIVRARFRHGVDSEDFVTPGDVEHYRMTLQPTANVFQPGHRIRLEISSSNFPMYDRNPNTGSPFGQDARVMVATQTVFHGPEHPSALHLQVIPGVPR